MKKIILSILLTSIVFSLQSQVFQTNGNLTVNGSIKGNIDGQSLRIQTNYGTLDLGPKNTEFAHIYSDRPRIIVNKPFYSVTGEFSAYDANNLILQTNGTTRLTITSNNGNVGIGMLPLPEYKLDVAGKIRANDELIVTKSDINIGGTISLANPAKTAAGQASVWRIFNMGGSYGNSLQFWAYDNVGCTSGGLCANRFTITDDGKVGIGTSVIPTDYKLAVTGKIIAEEVVVKLASNWPDYVFKPNYNLMPLHQVEQFVTTNNHLPGVPSATEVQNDGISMGEMQNKLLQKIEELTLYIIEQDKKITNLEEKLK